MGEMLQWGFMQRALLAGLLVGLICPVIGLFLVLRRLAMIGDTLAHVALTGVATGLLLGVYPVGMALGFTLLAAVGMDRLRAAYRRHGELAVAITLAAAVGLAGVLLSLSNAPGVDLFAYLFGSVVTVSRQDLYTIAGLSALVLIIVAALYKEFFFITFDEELARTGGLPVRGLGLLLTLMTAVTVAVAMRVVGVLLISSLMVLPVAASLQLARGFRQALILAVGFSELAVLVGLVASYRLDLAPGGTVVLTAVLLLAAVLAVKRVAAARGNPPGE